MRFPISFSYQLRTACAAGVAALTLLCAQGAEQKDDLVTLFDGHQFSDTELYPAGDLRPVTDEKARWTPASSTARPAEVVAFEDGPSDRGLRRHQTAANPTHADWLDFPPAADTRLTVKFDARVSTTQSRTLDLFLLRPDKTGPSHQASVLIWGYHPPHYFDSRVGRKQQNCSARRRSPVSSHE